MKYRYLVLLTTKIYYSIVKCDLPPDINLNVMLLTGNNSKVLQLICTTDIAVQLCTVEFLIDKTTHDTLRYFNNTCYHKLWICSPTVCSCSGDCKSFTVNVTVTQDKMNHLYTCASKIQKGGITYLANISVIHSNTGELKHLKKNVIPHESIRPAQKTTTFPPDISKSSFLSVPFIIALLSTGILGIAGLICVYRRWCRNSNTGSNDQQGQSVQMSFL